MFSALDNDECIAGYVLGRDKPGRIAGAAQSADAKTAALAQRVAFQPAVAADDGAASGLDRARTPRQPGPDEFAERALADEADSGRVALVGNRQAALARNGTYFGFPEPADRKFAEGEML